MAGRPPGDVNRKFQVRVVSPWFGELETDDAFLSVNISASNADALLCEWEPSDELFEFPRTKAWYCCEPWCQFRGLGGGSWPAIRARLAPHEFLFHNHADERYRVPHITHYDTPAVNPGAAREPRAVAIVSNYGGNPRLRHPDMSYRNRFITHSSVDLFGRDGWHDYRPRILSRGRAPANYRGELPGDWPAAGKRELLARYKVAVCLENMNEPNYFTEKFVEAVCAGCIPVYRAGDSIASGALEGAVWVDPRNYGDDPDATLRAAIALEREPVARQNAQWLTSNPHLAATRNTSVFSRIANLLGGGAAGQR